MSGGRWSVDSSAWPIVVHAVKGSLSDEALNAYIAEANSCFERPERFVAILDATHAATVSTNVRQRATQWQRDNADRLKARCLGTAYVVPSSVFRFVVMTVLLVSRLPTPYFVCGKREQAFDWARRQLGEGS